MKKGDKTPRIGDGNNRTAFDLVLNSTSTIGKGFLNIRNGLAGTDQ